MNTRNNQKNKKSNKFIKPKNIAKKLSKLKLLKHKKNTNTSTEKEETSGNNIKNYTAYKAKAKSKRISTKKLKILILACASLFILLSFRLIYWQVFDRSKLVEEMYAQLKTTTVISPKRGTIFDTTGKALAISADVDTVSVNPKKFTKNNSEGNLDESLTKNYREQIARALSDIFQLDYNETLEKVSSKNKIETIAKKVEQDKITELKQWMENNKIYSGINIDEDTKRYYPYESLASNLIGFCGSDNQGLSGLEYKWNSTLTGTPGQIMTSTDAVEEAIPDENEKYIPAENGSDITLSIDLNIQQIAEKYLKQAVQENNCKNGGNVIIMNPTSGDVLAMATYPDYNLNDPFSPNDNLKPEWDSKSTSEKSALLNTMWKNKAVTDTYEPGSTFKIITSSIALEENITDTDVNGDFLCSGYESINGLKISCWKTASHGYLSLRGALMNSCNPCFMQLGARIGKETMYKYFKAFGLFDKTGIETAGEANSYFYDLNDVGPIELAIMSFGQRFTITPIQLITAVCGIVNDGNLVQPHIVKTISNKDTGSTTTIDTKNVRQIISKETSAKMCDMLESVVTDGTAQYGKVKGYSIGGKTGTSEPISGKESDQGYVASFIGISPTDNPEVVILVTLYNPKGAVHSGGSLAAPVASQILSEVLPYLGIPSESETQVEDANDSVTLLDVRNKTFGEAKSKLESLGLNVSIAPTSSDTIITNQMPKPGTSLIKDSIVKLYSAGNEASVSTTVPNIKGKSLAQAKNALKAKNLNIHYTGSGTVISQDPSANTSVEEGTVINVILQQEITDTH